MFVLTPICIIFVNLIYYYKIQHLHTFRLIFCRDWEIWLEPYSPNEDSYVLNREPFVDILSRLGNILSRLEPYSPNEDSYVLNREPFVDILSRLGNIYPDWDLILPMRIPMCSIGNPLLTLTPCDILSRLGDIVFWLEPWSPKRIPIGLKVGTLCWHRQHRVSYYRDWERIYPDWTLFSQWGYQWAPMRIPVGPNEDTSGPQWGYQWAPMRIPVSPNRCPMRIPVVPNEDTSGTQWGYQWCPMRIPVGPNEDTSGPQWGYQWSPNEDTSEPQSVTLYLKTKPSVPLGCRPLSLVSWRHSRDFHRVSHCGTGNPPILAKCCGHFV